MNMDPTRELHFNDLPNELLHFVLEYLDKSDLTALAIASNRFSGVIWSLLRRLKISLKKIETDAGSLLKQCSELRYLEVSDGPNWQIESLALLPNPSYLTQLVLRNCDKFRLYDGSLEYYFPKLETLHFIGCPSVGDSALPWIPKHIKDLSLENCRKISDEGLSVLAKQSTSLTALDLKGCYRLSGEGLVHCLTQLTELKHIVLAKLYKLGDEHIEKITKQCSQLENVDIRFLRIEDRGLKAIEENCKNLKEIHLKFCTVTNPGVICLLSHSPKLTNIDLQGIKSLSDDALETIADHCPLAESIDLRDCTEIGKDTLKFEKMLTKCTNLQALMLRNMVVNDEVLNIIATSAPTSLRLLTMQECKNITLNGLKALSNSTLFKNLTLLDLTAIPFSAEDLEEINNLFLTKRWITCYSDDKKPRISIGFGTKWQEKPGL